MVLSHTLRQIVSTYYPNVKLSDALMCDPCGRHFALYAIAVFTLGLTESGTGSHAGEMRKSLILGR